MSPSRESLSDLQAYFGALPGDDRVLILWDAMRSWFRDVERASDRVVVEDIGEGELGAPMDLLIISSAETMRDLPQILSQRQSLTASDLLSDAAHDDGTLAGRKPVVLITAGIHATEVGGVQAMPEFVRELAFSDDPEITGMLERTIVLLVPTLNPDGMNLVHDWYTQTLDTKSEGTAPPELYHPYAGHDNNRDWYTHALAETRNTIDRVHRPWRPHVVLDLHQMGLYSPRYVVPPYIDPLEPHMHPRISALSTEIGSAILAAHVGEGHQGVASGVLFDCYSPTRAFQHYHGGARILAEAASAKIASPANVESHQVEVRRGFDPNVASTHMPIVWPGGTWRLRDIMDDHLTTMYTVIAHAARHADRLIRDQWAVLANDVRKDSAPTYVFAPLRQQIDPAAAVELVDLLRRGDVQIEYAESGNDEIQEGSLVVRSNQPFGSYAQALLDLTPYPQPRSGDSSELPTVPYDVTTHCLPIHMGVDVVRRATLQNIQTRPVSEDDLHPFNAPSAADVRRDRWLAIDARGHAAIRVVANALRNGSQVRRLLRPHFESGRIFDAGTWLITDDHVFASMSDAHRQNVRTWLINPVTEGTMSQPLPRIALYMPHHGSAIDAGWARLWLQQTGLPFELIHDADFRTGNLRDFDVVLITHLSPEILTNGNSRDLYPDEFSNGLGEQGIQAIGEFMEHGGRVIALDGATTALIPALHLPVGQPLASISSHDFSCPGSILQITPNPVHPLTLGMHEPVPIMFVNSTGFAVQSEEKADMAATYGNSDVVVSGWIRGENHLHDLGAIIDVPIGSGHFTGFGFRPHFRCQMRASEPLLTNALMWPRSPHGTRPA